MTSIGLQLRIENVAQLPDGGPLSVSLTGPRGLDIGRDAHLDWCLPDTERLISGKHCEVRYQGGAYLLFDVSRNGTFLNGSDSRMQSPHRLRSGDRVLIGDYIVAVEVQEDEAAAAAEPVAAPPTSDDDPWGGVADAAPPSDPRDLRPPAQRAPVNPDFLEWAVDVPNAPGIGFVARSQPEAAPQVKPSGEPAGWDAGPLPSAPEPPAPPPTPIPRRPVWNAEADRAWQEPPPVDPSAASPAEPAPAPSSAPAPSPAPPFSVVARPIAPDENTPTPAPIAQRFVKGAGLPAHTALRRDGGDLAEWLGHLMLLVTDNVKQLLDARGQTKRIVRSGNQTSIEALDNNPLKFTPTAADALQIMVGPPTRSYLEADVALRQAFDDLKAHQVKTFAAMQRALAMLLEDLDPQAIDAALGADKGASAWLGSRKARLWESYTQRWQAMTGRKDRSAQDLFMQYFAECYDQAAQPPASGSATRRLP